MDVAHVRNNTPFSWFAFEKMAPGHVLYDIIVIKGRIDLSQDAHVAPPIGSIRSSPIHYADLPHTSDLGGYAPLREASDVLLIKPATDIWISGSAHPIPSRSVALACRSGFQKVLRLINDQHGTISIKYCKIYIQRSFRQGLDKSRIYF